MTQIRFLGFGYAVGIGNDAGTWFKVDLLRLIGEIPEQAHRNIGFAMEKIWFRIRWDDQDGVMSSITIVHVPRPKVEAGNKQGHEHTRFVGCTKLIVDTAQGLIQRQPHAHHEAKHHPCDGHHQRGSDALARHITDSEIELVALQSKVVQVSTHNSCRVKHCIHKRRKLLDQHSFLDFASQVKVRLIALIDGGGGFQFLNIIDEGVLHGLEAVVQTPHLILTLDFGQLRFQITLGHP